MTLRCGHKNDVFTIKGGIWKSGTVFYTNLPSFIQKNMPMYGTNDVNTADNNTLVLNTAMTAYMFRVSGWKPVDLNGWTLVDSGSYLGPYQSYQTVNLYRKTLNKGTHIIDNWSAMYLFTDVLEGNIFVTNII